MDSGSQSHLTNDNIVKRLSLPIRKYQTWLIGLCAMDELHQQGTIDFLLTPKNETAIPVIAFVMPKLTDVLPSSTVMKMSWKHLPNLRPVDTTFITPSGIDIILVGCPNQGKQYHHPPYFFFFRLSCHCRFAFRANSIAQNMFELNEVDSRRYLGKFCEIKDLPRGRHLTKKTTLWRTLPQNDQT